MNHSMTIDAPQMSMGRLLQAYFTDAKYEARRMLRSPAFAIPFLLLPVPMYLLFGVVMAAQNAAKNPQVYDLLFVGFSVVAVMGPALFGIGATLASERDAGLMKLKRALPAPAGSYLIAKMLMAMFFALIAMLMMITAAKLVGKISLTAPELAALTAVLMIGAVPFCAVGLAIGAHFSGGAAPAVTNLVYLPMMWLGGLFIPLPAFLQKWVVVWPAFHLQQLALTVAGVDRFTYEPAQIAGAVLVGVTVLFGGIAIRRLARVG
jgi:ABC-2 type transport system permease protein